MTLERILDELKTVYESDGDKDDALLTPWEIDRWSNELQMKPVALYDLLALRLAVGFHRGELTFEFCDAVINDLYSVAISALDEWGEWQRLFWSVYTAFDGRVSPRQRPCGRRRGEIHAPNDR
jgi:hypothetical protein